MAKAKTKTSTKQAKPAAGAIKKAILAREKVFMAKYNGGDAPGLAALYTTDGHIMPPNTPTAKGRAQIAKLIRSFWKAGDIAIKLTTLEVAGEVDLAYEVGLYALSDKRGKTTDKGKYIVVWKKVGGTWMLFRDIFNSDMPLPS